MVEALVKMIMGVVSDGVGGENCERRVPSVDVATYNNAQGSVRMERVIIQSVLPG